MQITILILLISILMQKENENAEVVFGGGCFWCTEAIFKQINGVKNITPGYSGGNLHNPDYESVCSGETGHAEVVKIQFNPSEISFEKLLEIFFLTHDPTSLNQQGADIGTQYRSVVFYTTPEQEKTTTEIIKQLTEIKVYQKPIVTEVLPLKEFYLAENYHQNYFERNRNAPYCRFVIQPKIDKFKQVFSKHIKK